MSRAPRSAAARRSWGEDDTGCTILHLDMDAFFVAVELLDRPELHGRPVIVGGQQRGVVAAASYEARRYGIHSAMPASRARALCPDLVVLPAQRGRYVEVSRQVMQILSEVTETVEQLSIDEAFLDVRPAIRRMGPPTEIARWLRREIHTRLDLPASVGLASTKHVAKLASAHAKPDGLLLIPAAATVDFLHSLPAGALWGVGERAQQSLAAHGIETVRDIAHTTEGELRSILGAAAARKLLDLAWGRDPRPVQPGREEKSIGTESTFPQDVSDRAELGRVLLSQAHACAARLRKAGFAARRVAIKVRFPDFTTLTRSRTLADPTDTAHDLHGAAMELLAAVQLPRGGVRLLGLRAEQLQHADVGVQMALDFEEGADSAAAERAMDGVRARFGNQVLLPASLLTSRRSTTADASGDIS
ncbi:DNA polymerase IV [Bogoriella caseilytica]|uniref:DNA polymerase IV n=1 Tax=Bogoriella caseilytica TaxID=56055 RepID=A0A3N2B9C5_9MICO|nr:DNA polymerase IV [Bogoriella caseilytica]ROR71850.1 DNA polymerase-4 [Bogoriella caseilytica]